MSNKVYILGGAQTDFERNWTKEGKNFIAMLKEAVADGFEEAGFSFEGGQVQGCRGVVRNRPEDFFDRSNGGCDRQEGCRPS